MTLALLFPGQGSQSVGMGAALADAFASAREVFAEVDDALNQKLFDLMREGPEDQLTLTENAQPALMAVSAAAAASARARSVLGPISEAMVPLPTGTARCMAWPRSFSRRAVSDRLIAPTAASAEYSPSE